MDKLLDKWVSELSPIHAAIETFTKGGPQCGAAIEALYRDLLAMQHEAADLQDAIGDNENAIEDLEARVLDLQEEVVKLKKMRENA